MLKKVAHYRQAVHAARMWISVIRQLQTACETTPIGERGPIIAEIHKFESMFGSVVLSLIGVYPIDHGSWD